MPDKTVAQKARVKPGTRIAVLNDVPDVVALLGLPDDVVFVGASQAQLVFLFVNTRSELETQLAPVLMELAPGSAIWVFFRKGSKAAGLDMNRDTVWSVAASLDMRPLGLIGVDDVWSAFRLRGPS